MARGGGKGKKKKSAKGKKARAKAKLDRHWGQHVDDEEIRAAKHRKGRSRLLQGNRSSTRREAADQDKNFEATNNVDKGVDVNSSEYSSNEDDSDTEMESPNQYGAGGALDSLLSSMSSIGGRSGGKGGSTSSHRRATARDGDMDSDCDADADLVADDVDRYEDEMVRSDDDNASVFESSDDDADEQAGNHDDNDDDDATTRGEDGFAAHFNKAPLPESDEALAKAIAPLQKVRKVPCGTSHLDSSLEVMLSGPMLERLQNVADKDANQTFAEMSDGYYSSLRQVLAKNWKKINAKSVRRNVDGNDVVGNERGTTKPKMRLTALQSTLFPSLSSYSDLQITAESRQNRHDINNLLALHVLNHVLTSRGRVQKHNKRMKELREREANSADDVELGGAGGEGLADEADEERWRDQGYTRPKVLVLLPTRGTALTFAKRVVSLMSEFANIDHLGRFEAEYSAGIDDKDEDDDEEGRAQRKRAVLESKGSDWNELFGEQANDDDDFKIGMSLTPNAARRSKKRAKGTGKDASGGISVKFYSEFYRSDIILASPLALKMATSGDEDNDVDMDFLSSIEVCLVLHADVLLMQNWDHVASCLEVLNQQPTKSNDTDFSRVRNYLLAGQAAYWKQLVFVSRLSDPYITSTFKRHAKSVGGRLKLRRKVTADKATITDVLFRVRQVFQRVPCDIKTQGDARLNYFTEKVLPQIIRLRQKHTLIYVPSYFDFVSLRNVLMKNEATTSNFVCVTEYSRVSEVSRGRARFNQGRKAIMLYTGRAHFFLRHKLKGARHLILFGLPEHAEFYPDLMNMLMEGPSGESEVEGEAPSSCLALFTRYDAHALERIVGTKHCERMVKGEKNTFLFCS